MKVKIKYKIKLCAICFLLLNIFILPKYVKNINIIKKNFEENKVLNEYSKNINNDKNVVKKNSIYNQSDNKNRKKIMSTIYFALFLCIIVSVIVKDLFIEEN